MLLFMCTCFCPLFNSWRLNPPPRAVHKSFLRGFPASQPSAFPGRLDHRPVNFAPVRHHFTARRVATPQQAEQPGNRPRLAFRQGAAWGAAGAHGRFVHQMQRPPWQLPPETPPPAGAALPAPGHRATRVRGGALGSRARGSSGTIPTRQPPRARRAARRVDRGLRSAPAVAPRRPPRHRPPPPPPPSRAASSSPLVLSRP